MNLLFHVKFLLPCLCEIIQHVAYLQSLCAWGLARDRPS